MQSTSEDESPDEVDNNKILSALLDRVEFVIADVRSGSGAKPLFVVEAELTLKLSLALPGVRFMADDISVSGQPKFPARGGPAAGGAPLSLCSLCAAWYLSKEGDYEMSTKGSFCLVHWTLGR